MSERAVTFVVVADASAASELTASARSWVEAGLVRDFLVAAAPDVIGVEEPVARWAHGDELVRTQSVLASQPYSTVRVVAQQWLHRGSSGDHDVPNAARMLSASFRPRLAGSQELVELNLLVPDDRVRNLPPDLLAMHGSANVVLAPEDRESPGHASHPLDDDERVRAHGVVGLFGVAGLWRHQAEGPFDASRHAAFNEMPHAFVVRCFSRIARAPMLVEQVTNTVLEHRATAPWAAEAVGGVAAADPYGITTTQAQTFLARHERSFAFTPPRLPSPPKRESVGAGRAFVMMFRYIGTGLRNLPVELASHASDVARRAVADFAQEVTFGPDSKVAVHGSSGLAEPAEDLTARGSDMATALLSRAGGAVPVPPAAGDAWQDLRQVALALVDGSQFPTGFDRPSDGVVLQVVTDPHAIAPDPDAGSFQPGRSIVGQLPPSARGAVRPSDAAQAAHLRDSLEADARLDPEDEDAALAPPGTTEEELARLDEWTDQRRRSLTWIIGDQISTNLANAHKTFSDALSRVRQGAASDEGLTAQRARKRMHRRWWIWLLVVAALAGYGWYAFASSVRPPTGTELVIGGVVTIVALFLGWLVAFVSFLRTLFQLRHRLDRQDAEYKAAVSAAIQSAESIVQLSSLNRQFRDWAEVIGWMVHHPGTPLTPPEEVDVPGMDLSMPASHRLAVAEGDEQALTRLAAVVGRRMFGPGWLVGLFSQQRDAAMATLRYELGHPDTVAPPDPDHDAQAGGPRDYLLRQIRSRDPARAWSESRLEVVTQRLATVPSEDLFETVATSTGEHEGAHSFLFGALRTTEDAMSRMVPGLWRNTALMGRREAIVESYGWSTTRIPADLAEGIKEQPTNSGVVGESTIHDVAVLRVDTTTAVPFTDLALFVQPSLQVAEPEAKDEDGEVW